MHEHLLLEGILVGEQRAAHRRAQGAAAIVDLRKDATRADIDAEVSRMGLSKWNTFAPTPSVATRARSAATSPAGASVRSRMTCQRIDGSESSSQSVTVRDLPPASKCIVPSVRRIWQASPGEQLQHSHRNRELPNQSPGGFEQHNPNPP
jgi:hypothetical protein